MYRKQERGEKGDRGREDPGEEEVEHSHRATEEPETQAMTRTRRAEVRGKFLGFPLTVRVGNFRRVKPQRLPAVADRHGSLELPVVDREALGVVNDPQPLEDIDVGQPTGGEEED